jgi:hypothetical protein
VVYEILDTGSFPFCTVKRSREIYMGARKGFMENKIQQTKCKKNRRIVPEGAP